MVVRPQGFAFLTMETNSATKTARRQIGLLISGGVGAVLLGIVMLTRTAYVPSFEELVIMKGPVSIQRHGNRTSYSVTSAESKASCNRKRCAPIRDIERLDKQEVIVWWHSGRIWQMKHNDELIVSYAQNVAWAHHDRKFAIGALIFGFSLILYGYLRKVRL